MKQLQRVLPTVELAGASFFVDAFAQKLIDTQNEGNTISLLEMMVMEDHQELLFDKQTRNVKQARWDKGSADRYEYIWLRPLGYYDPEGARALIAANGAPQNALPVIDIEGTKFHWDSTTTRLQQVDHPWNIISRNDGWYRDSTYGIYFDTKRNVVPFPAEMLDVKEAAPLPERFRFVPWADIVRKIHAAERELKQPPPWKEDLPKIPTPSKNKGRKIR